MSARHLIQTSNLKLTLRIVFVVLCLDLLFVSGPDLVNDTFIFRDILVLVLLLIDDFVKLHGLPVVFLSYILDIIDLFSVNIGD